MKLTYGVLVLLGSAPQALAWEPMEFGPFSLELSGGMEAMALRGPSVEETTTEADLAAKLIFSQPVGALNFSAKLAAKLEFDSADDPQVSMDDPDLSLWLEGDGFGLLSFNDDSSAIDELCVEAPGAGEVFDNDEFAELGTCPSFDDGAVLYYQSPAIGQWTFGVSYMPDAFLPVDDGDAAESVSAAVLWAAEAANGAEWQASFGFEQVLALKGAAEKPLGAQIGLSWARNDWEIGGALAHTDLDDGSSERALGLGGKRKINDWLQIALGLNLSQEGTYRQTSLSGVAELALIPDQLTLDLGLWRNLASDAGVRSGETVAGLAISFEF